MIFTLEVLQADHGDCLLLHYGSKDAPKHIVIDGGPGKIYKKSLKPRLLEIRDTCSPDAALPLSMVMVSHLDDDHVNGILALTDDVIQRKDDHEPAEFDIENLWVNSFDDIIGNIVIPAISTVSTSAQPADINSLPLPAGVERSVSAVIASTGQGRKLRDNASKLSLPVNKPFDELEPGKAALIRSDGNDSIINWEELKITVLHPNGDRLKNLQKQWDEDLKEAKRKGDNSIIIASIIDSDKSPFNLSSIVCLVETQGKRILLTGDARTDDILEGLETNNLLDTEGRFHVDILKLPHHGSIRNASTIFYEKVTADHYVISANGKFDNPDQELLDMVAETVRNGRLHFTNHDGQNDLKEKLDVFVEKLNTIGSNLQVEFKEQNEPIVLDLLENIDF